MITGSRWHEKQKQTNNLNDLFDLLPDHKFLLKIENHENYSEDFIFNLDNEKDARITNEAPVSLILWLWDMATKSKPHKIY